ncbi:MAG: aldo/keto reductase [Oscillospiraceae bacterium]|nr:aldo/keto reductase [Oscillospiraceae bacterium]
MYPKFTTASGKPISDVMMGTMIIGTDNYDKSAPLLDDAMGSGINAFDLAHIYYGGQSEMALGRWMEERGNRADVFILTKGAHPEGDRSKVNRDDITSDLLESLRRLRTDYIDAYVLHRDDLSVPVSHIVDALHEHREAGRIKAFGGSNWTHARMAEANAYAAANGKTPMTVTSPNLSLCEQVNEPWHGCVTIGGKGGGEARAYYAANGIPVFAYSSLGRGMLSGRVTRENHMETLDGAARHAYAHEVNFRRLDRATEMAASKGCTVPQIGLAYLLGQSLKVYPIVGAASGKEIREIVDALNLRLTEGECAWLENGEAKG